MIGALPGEDSIAEEAEPDMDVAARVQVSMPNLSGSTRTVSGRYASPAPWQAVNAIMLGWCTALPGRVLQSRPHVKTCRSSPHHLCHVTGGVAGVLCSGHRGPDAQGLGWACLWLPAQQTQRVLAEGQKVSTPVSSLLGGQSVARCLLD